MYLFRKLDGTISKTNVFAALVFLLGALEALKPVIPVEYLPYALGAVGFISFVLRTWFTDQPISKG